jgi:hypothetical protein
LNNNPFSKKVMKKSTFSIVKFEKAKGFRVMRPANSIPDALYRYFDAKAHLENFQSGNVWFASRTRNRYFQDAERCDEMEGRDKYSFLHPKTGGELHSEWENLGYLGLLSLSKEKTNIENKFHLKLLDPLGFLNEIAKGLFKGYHEITWIEIEELMKHMPVDRNLSDHFGKQITITVNSIGYRALEYTDPQDPASIQLAESNIEEKFVRSMAKPLHMKDHSEVVIELNGQPGLAVINQEKHEYSPDLADAINYIKLIGLNIHQFFQRI